MESNKNKILIFGGTGHIGKYMVEASISLGYPTFVYSRPIDSKTSTYAKIERYNNFNSMGVTLVEGELEHDQIVKAIKQVDIVICTFPFPLVMEQLKIIDAIKAAGNIKRFLPSEFGVHPLPQFQAVLDNKIKIRREIEAAGIPYTLVSPNCFGAYLVSFLLHLDAKPCAKNDITVYGNGETKAILNYEGDIAMYTIKVANDTRTHNRIVVYRPSKNIITQNDLISLWEQKSGLNFNKVFVSSEEDIVKRSQTLVSPEDIRISIVHSIFVKGELVNSDIGEDELEASQLYSDYTYTSIDQLLDKFIVHPLHPEEAALFD